MEHKFKRMLCFCTALALSAASVPQLVPPGSVLAAPVDSVEMDGITYEIYTDHAELTTTNWEQYDIIDIKVPEKVQGVPVTVIDRMAFWHCDLMKTIELPDTLKTIGEEAFTLTRSLSEITIPDSVESIGDSAFSESALTSVTLGKGLKSIGKAAFADTSLQKIKLDSGNKSFKLDDGALYTADGKRLVYCATESADFAIKEGTTDISYAFCGNANLTALSVPASVTDSAHACKDCKNLETLTFADGLEDIDNDAFTGTEKLKEITIPASVKRIGAYAFAAGDLNQVTFLNASAEIDETMLWNYEDEDYCEEDEPDPEELEEYQIQIRNFYNGTVYSYEDSTAQEFAEKNDYKFSALETPEDYYTGYEENGILYHIYKDHAVAAECTDSSLTDVTIPEKVKGVPVTEIGKTAFYLHEHLESIVLPSTVRKIGNSAFRYAVKLKAIDFGGTEIIGAGAFECCWELVSPDLTGGIREIGTYAFRDCCDIDAVTLGEHVEKLGIGVFADSGLTAITVLSDNPALTVSDGVLYSADQTVIYAAVKSIDSFVVPNGVKSLSNAFEGHPISEITIPGSVTVLNDREFYRSSNLEKVTLKKGTEKIGDDVFVGTLIKEAVVPESVISTGSDAFDCGTGSIQDITFLNPTCEIGKLKTADFFADEFDSPFWEAPEEYDPDAYGYVEFGGTIHGYADSTAQKFAEENDYHFAVLESLPFTDYTEDGILYHIFEDHAEVAGAEEAVENAEIPEKVKDLPVTAIGEKAFFQHFHIQRISLPQTVKTIGNKAFKFAENLCSVAFGGTEVIGTEAFANCGDLETLDLTGVRRIGSYAFKECVDVVSVTLGGSLEQLGNGVFSYNKNLSAIDVLPSNTHFVFSNGILYSADQKQIFAAVCGIETFDVPEGVETLSNAFEGHEKLYAVTVPGSVTELNDREFFRSSLQIITLGEGTEKIGDDVFGETNVRLVEVPKSVRSTGSGAFDCATGYIEEVTFLNPACEIGPFKTGWCVYDTDPDSPYWEPDESWDTEDGDKLPDFEGIIYGYADSTAQAFAEENNYIFMDLEKPVIGKVKYTIEGDSAYVSGFEDGIEAAYIRPAVKGKPVKKIGENAFSGCETLKELFIPDTVTEIGDFAFRDCTNLVNDLSGSYTSGTICIPKSVKRIGKCAFQHCGKVKEFEFGAKGDPLAAAEVKSDLEEIAFAAFEYCYALENVYLPPSVKTIGVQAFRMDQKLQYAILPGAETIDRQAFSSCSALNVIDMGSSLKTIGNQAFEYCKSLGIVSIPDTVLTVGSLAFSGCTALEYISFMSQKTEIYDSAETISGTDGTYTGTIIGYSASEAKKYAEKYGYKFQYASDNAKSIINIDGVVYRLDVSSVAVINCSRDLKDAKIRASVRGLPVTKIDWQAFMHSGIETVTIPDTPIIIGGQSFAYCKNLREFDFGGTTEIQTSAFKGTDLAVLDLPDSVVKLSKEAFYGASLHTLKIGSGLQTISADAFKCDRFPDLIEVSEDNPYFKVENGALMKTDGTRIVTLSNEVSEYEIPDGVTNIQKAFYYHPNLKKVTVPSSVTNMSNAFLGCTNLTEAVLSEGLDPSYSEYAFSSTALTEITIPDSLKVIGTGMFEKTHITEITLPASVQQVYSYAFRDCNDLKSIVFLNPECEINEWMLYDSAWKDKLTAEELADASGQESVQCFMLTDVIISGFPGSTARAFADMSEHNFIPVCNVSFDANGGKGAMEGGIFIGQLTLPECSFTAPEGKSFAGWHHPEDDTVMPAGTEFHLPNEIADVVLKAAWENAYYTVAFDANGGEGEMASSVVEYGTEITLPQCSIPAPAGKRFAGWKFGKKVFQPGAVLTVTKDTVLTAQWEDLIYTMKFTANNGTDEATELTYKQGETFTLPECSFTAPESKAFAGWLCGANLYQPGDSLTADADALFIAMWDYSLVTVSFDANGGEGEMASLTVLSGSSFVLPECTFTAPEGRKFGGWQNQASEENPVCKAGSIMTASEDMTLIPVWYLDSDTPYSKGNFNMDDKIDSADAMLLSRFVNGWEGIEIDEEAADMNNDGAVTVRDAMILSRYVNGWEGYDKYFTNL